MTLNDYKNMVQESVEPELYEEKFPQATDVLVEALPHNEDGIDLDGCAALVGEFLTKTVNKRVDGLIGEGETGKFLASVIAGGLDAVAQKKGSPIMSLALKTLMNTPLSDKTAKVLGNLLGGLNG